MIRLLTSGWQSDLLALVSEARKELAVATPYVKDYGARLVLDNLSDQVALRSLVGLDHVDLVHGSTDYSAIWNLAQRGEIRYLPSLHAKVHVSESSAIVTSGNLTQAGLVANSELGILMDDASILSQLRRELQALWD